MQLNRPRFSKHMCLKIKTSPQRKQGADKFSGEKLPMFEGKITAISSKLCQRVEKERTLPILVGQDNLDNKN